MQFNSPRQKKNTIYQSKYTTKHKNTLVRSKKTVTLKKNALRFHMLTVVVIGVYDLCVNIEASAFCHQRCCFSTSFESQSDFYFSKQMEIRFLMFFTFRHLHHETTNNGTIMSKSKKEKPIVNYRRVSKQFPALCKNCIKSFLMNMSAKEQVNCK